MTDAIDYSAPGRLTDIGEVSMAVLDAIPADPVGICRLVPGLVLHPFEATDLGLDADRLGGREIRQASAILRGVLEHSFVAHPEDLQPGEFLTGGEAWTSYRHGGIDAATFGVEGTENFGPAEISGNTIRDLAALNKVEMLPWDEGGQMTAAYAGQAGPGYDELIDEVAAACASDSPRHVADLYSRPELRVPAELIQ